MVHGVAAQSGGRLHIKSEINKGTTAEMWLPRAAAINKSSERMTGSAGERITAIHPAAPSVVVLVVDDDPLVLRNTAVMIEDLGHTAIEARSGRAALKCLRERSEIDLVITDQVMPEMTGLQLADHIASEWKRIPVVLASGYSELPLKSLGYKRLQKPFGQKELSAAIDAAIAKSRSPTGRTYDQQSIRHNE
jgi:CheY-like chemotaxis protein